MGRGRRVRKGSPISNPTPHFSKIILKANLQSGVLMIPNEFIRQYTKKIADVAVLKVPTGRKWEVEVRKEDESVILQNGWREFLEYYSISVGDFLVFRYDGNSTFSVFIFNRGACEIDYPSDTDNDLHMNHIKEGKSPSFDAVSGMEVIEVSSEDESLQFNGCEPLATAISKVEINCLEQESKARNGTSATAISKVEINCLEQESKARNGTSATECDAGKHLDSRHEENASMSSSHSYKRVVAPSKRSVKYQQREKAKYAAQVYKTENPYVMIIMKPSYVKGMTLNFPKDFALKYLNYGLHSVKVSDSDGRTWILRCSVSPLKAMISGGWIKFVQDNKLKHGDCCFFEVSKAEGMELKVSIFRAVEEAEQISINTISD